MRQLMVFTGGGTGGHVYPGLAVIQALRRRWDGEIVWIGSRGGLERSIVAGAGLRFIGIPAGKLRRSFSPANLVDVFKVAAGFLASLVLLLRLKPCLVFSKGGYVSVPPVLAAWLLGIPVITHESDFDPGLATRINSRFARRVLIPYEESRRFYPGRIAARLAVTGNPVREEIRRGSRPEGLRLLDFDGAKPVVLAIGGSQGARELNELVAGCLDGLLELADLVHQTGSAADPPAERKGYRVFAYLAGELPDVLAAADLVVSRAGAGSVWELATAGKPALLIPLRGPGTRGDQLRNAELFARRGLATILTGDDLAPRDLLAAVGRALEGGRADDAFESFKAADAASAIAEIVLEEVRA